MRISSRSPENRPRTRYHGPRRSTGGEEGWEVRVTPSTRTLTTPAHKPGTEFVEATVYVRTGGNPPGYEAASRMLDPGDFRLMYEVRSLKRAE